VSDLSLETQILLSLIEKERTRKIVEMRFRGYTYREIAKHFDRSAERVRQLVSAEIRKFRTKLRKDKVYVETED